MLGRHTEFFGPDLARGPFSSQRIETSALQIATALAQLRAPLTRSDDDVRNHATFIRELADRLAPDWAAQVYIQVGIEAVDAIPCTIGAVTGTYSVLDIWLTDYVGGGLTTVAPTGVNFGTGVILETIAANRRYLVITPISGVINVTVTYTAARSWYWGVSRQGRVYYSSRLFFT